MKKVEVNASKKYDVIIGDGLIDRSGDIVCEYIRPCHAVIITDDTVAELYLERFESSLKNANFHTDSIIIPHGENSKSAENYIKILNKLATFQLSRSDVLFALGGGVVGDLTGFVASTYLRGIKFIQVPTTLLAMVDSSVGGKTAINLDAGKNLAGAFYQPSLVICDYSSLSTLPREIFFDGCAEVIKYGIINDKNLFERLQNPIAPQIASVIETCVKNKSDIVSADEYDNSSRQLLNLGHTVGHAIEKLSNFTVSHGKAVAIGTAAITRCAYKLGYCSEHDALQTEQLLAKYNLPTSCEYSARELADVAICDKKRSGDKINLIIPFGIGNCKIVPVLADDLCEFFSNGI